MQVIVVFVLFAAGLDAIAVGICSFIERYSENVSLLVFLGFFVLNFVAAWHLAVYVIDHYFVTETQKRKNEEHKKWVNSLFIPVRR
jgi:divalent metal cation (Fe/Co/Zn/Cd) transporter